MSDFDGDGDLDIGASHIGARSRPDVPLRLVHDPRFEHDVQRRVPSTAKAKEVLGFEATTSLDNMLGEVIPWIAHAVTAGTI